MEVIKEYTNYIKDKKKLSDNTVLSYYTDIKKYIDYLKSINLELSDVVENDIIGYIINLEKENISVATVSRMISSIKSFHDYLFLGGLPLFLTLLFSWLLIILDCIDSSFLDDLECSFFEFSYIS